MTTTKKATANKPTELPANEVFKIYLAHLKAESWCIDTAANYPRAFHALGNQYAGAETFKLMFSGWSHATGIRVMSTHYKDFEDTLTDKLMKKLPLIFGAAFKPTLDRIFKNYAGLSFANTYVPYAPDIPVNFEIPPILDEYLRRVFPDSADRKAVVQFLADIIQNPTRRPQFGLLITGLAGTGKSTIIDIIKLALGGKHYYHKGAYGPVFDDFADVLSNTLVVCFDDAPASKNTVEVLKDAITCKTRQVQLKYAQGLADREVFARIIVCSNKIRPLAFVDHDRRFYVPARVKHLTPDEDETKIFFSRFWNWLLSPDTPAILYHWLKSFDLSDFVHGSTVQTETHRMMMGLSASGVDVAIASFVEDFDGEPVFHINTLLSELKRGGTPHPKLDSVRLKLGALGLQEKRRVIPDFNDGKQIPIWQKECSRAKPLTPEQIAAIKDAYGNRPSFP